MADRMKREAEWAKAKRVCRLNVETVRMAKELGLNPRSLMKNIPSKSQPWKAPVHVWIRDMYEARQEKAGKKARKLAEQAAGNPAAGQTEVVLDAGDEGVPPARSRESSPAPSWVVGDEPNGAFDGSGDIGAGEEKDDIPF